MLTITTIGCCELYLADCRALLPSLQGITILLTDPPYGVGYRQKRSRNKWVHPDTVHPQIAGDDAPFDPTHLLAFPRVILWGANHYSEKLLQNACWLIWDKRRGKTPDDSADCELAWTNLQGPARTV